VTIARAAVDAELVSTGGDNSTVLVAGPGEAGGSVVAGGDGGTSASPTHSRHGTFAGSPYSAVLVECTSAGFAEALLASLAKFLARGRAERDSGGVEASRPLADAAAEEHLTLAQAVSPRSGFGVLGEAIAAGEEEGAGGGGGGGGGVEPCDSCGEPQKGLLKCSKCHTAKYCSRACQARNWDVHKKQCKTLLLLKGRK